MKALSIMQPWARLLAGGEKRFETRSWSTDYRGAIAIHASNRMDGKAQALALELTMSGQLSDNFPLGAIVGVGYLIEIFPTGDILDFGGASERELRLGNFERGRFAWLFSECKPLVTPIPCHGQLSLWNWTPPPGYEDPQGGRDL